ncbi:hypothetical protein [Azospirillum brasilense]|uniref:hypothetical protein n=1 Tax=Azospirillum brasilense TaxID=192 RepID=UPI0011AAA072|nr:hypothetical protein [Azospirillum brasilense]
MSDRIVAFTNVEPIIPSLTNLVLGWWRRMRRFIINFLTGIGTISVVGLGLFLLIGRNRPFAEDHFSVVGALSSPDSQHQAIMFVAAGGGGISPYCVSYISVIKLGSDFSRAFNERNQVLVSGCDGVSDWNNDVSWTSNSELLIKVNLNVGVRDVSNMLLRGHAADPAIRIRYKQ